MQRPGTYIRTEEINRKSSKTRNDLNLSKGSNNPMFGKKHSDQTKSKIGARHYSKKSDETIRKMLESRKANKLILGYKNLCKECGVKVRSGAIRCRKCHWEYKRKSSSRNKKGTSKCKIVYPKEFNKKLKEKIKYRDKYCCSYCGMTEEQHRIKYGKGITIHHIDHNVFNNLAINLITTCMKCNLRANRDILYWKEFYTRQVL